MHDALEVAQAACDRSPKDPAAWWLLGRVSRHAGLPAASDEAFRRAHELKSSLPLPHRVTAKHFRQLIEEASAGAAVRCQLIPSAEQVSAGLDPDALAESKPPASPTLFQVNHENRCASEDELRELVRRSVLETRGP
jgi:hypothetical protein